ncbi:MAG: hypothetical protein WBO55_04160 [Rhizobiaceae bacterium]
MNLNLAISPLLSWPLLSAVAILSGLLVAWGLWQQLRGAWFRLLAWLLVMASLLNPVMLVEFRDPLKSVVSLVVDRSSSQKLDGRTQKTDAIVAGLRERLARLDSFDVREVEVGDQLSTATDVSTALLGALSNSLRDVPPDRVGGAILVTDGQVHDIPASLDAIGIGAPVHALVVGRSDERDRRMTIISAPRYAVVGEEMEIVYRVEQTGFSATEQVKVTILADGEVLAVEEVLPGEDRNFIENVPHGGKNIFELRVEAAGAEITDVNNRAFVTLNGIRENLRVLLISGEPHAGERTWRNLLKSDPSVDLVHFTILRPPEKQDGTPINQLSLIAFPTRELFVQKIDEFDLIIFDRYRRRNVLPLLYFDNIVRYVRDGGALLIAGGPELGNTVTDSIAGPLAELMPAAPTGETFEGPFKPMVSQLGLKHPVTRNLDGWRESGPLWGEWFRTIGSTNVTGQAVMSGNSDAPVLVLNHFGEGRVALFLSDQAWLWARGIGGGGPYVQMLRRTAHWLMREPELDEERLVSNAEGLKLKVERQTLGEDPGPATLTGPAGEQIELPLANTAPGLWTGEMDVPGFGLWSAANGELKALAHAGPPNPREFAEVISTTALLEPVLTANGGSAQRTSADYLPRIVPVRPGAPASGNSWIGLENTNASVLLGIQRIPLFSGLLGLGLLLMGLTAMWTREGQRR